MKKRIALVPQRGPGRKRVAALLEAGAAVITERGFQAATMAEIAARADSPIGSLYRFFPNKEILADALLQRYTSLVRDAFAHIQRQIKTLSTAELAEAFLTLMVDLRGETQAVVALLEGHTEWSTLRLEFRHTMRRHIAETLLRRRPRLNPKVAKSMAVLLLQNMKTVRVLTDEVKGDLRTGALAELHEMTRLYLAHKLEE